ncbi:MAG: metal ABC transporter substrate-binding protein [Thermoproteota archaeon]
MRKLLVLAILLLIVVASAGIPPVNVEASSNDGLDVVVTISPLYMIVREVAGSRARIHVLAPAGVDPHSYAPTPSDALKVISCDLFVCSGKEEFLGQLPSPEHGLVLGWDSWIGCGIYVRNDNPHYLWLYPPNAKNVAWLVAEAMSNLDPSNAIYYRSRCEAFCDVIENMEAWLHETTRTLQRKNILLAGDHFEPLVEWMGLNVSYVIMVGHESLPGPQRIKDAIIAARTSDIMIVSATQSKGYEASYAKQVSDASGIPMAYVYGVPPSMVDSYSEYIKYNTMIILSHLIGERKMSLASSSEEICRYLLVALLSATVIEGIIIVRLRRR